MGRRSSAFLLLAVACRAAPPAPPPGPIREGIVFTAVERRTAPERLRLWGTVVRPGDAEAAVPAAEAGVVVDMLPPGTAVAKGACVARLRPPHPPDPEIALELARARDEQLRLEGLWQQGLVAWIQADQARREVARLERALATEPPLVEARAPIAGRLSQVLVPTGAACQAGTPLARIVDDTRWALEAAVAEPFLRPIRPGLRGDVSLTALPGLRLEAQLVTCAPAADPVRRDLDVEFALHGDTGSLRPGLGATVDLDLGERSFLAIPSQALLRRGGRTLVASRSRGAVRLREVEVRPRGDGLVEVMAGLEPGDEIASRDAAWLAPPPPAPAPPPSVPPTRGWLVVPEGRGPTLAAALPKGTVADPPPTTTRIRLDARAMALGFVTLGRALAAPLAGPPVAGVEVSPGAPISSRRWTLAAGQRRVDALPLTAGSPAAIARAARSADPETTWIGAELPADGWPGWLSAAGALLLLGATGSLRAALLTGGAALLAARGFAGRPEVAGASGAAALAAVAVIATSLAADYERPRLRSVLRAALAESSFALLPAAALVAGLAARWPAPGSSPAAAALVAVARLSVGLPLAVAVALVLGWALRSAPTASSYTRAPIERFPAFSLALALVLLGGTGLLWLARPATTADLVAYGSSYQQPALLDRMLAGVARRALSSGASSVTAATAADGRLHLLIDGQQAPRIAADLVRDAPPGLGLGQPRERARPLEPGSLLGTRVAPEEARLASRLASGPVQEPDRLVELRDEAAWSLLPLATLAGGIVYAGELGLAPAAVEAVTVHPVDSPWSPPAGRLASVPDPWLAYIAVAGLVTLAAALRTVLASRRRGTSWRRRWSEARPHLMRVCAAATGGAAVGSVGLPGTLVAAGLAAAWGAVLLAAAVAAGLPHSTARASSRSQPPPGRALPPSRVAKIRSTRSSRGGSRRDPSLSRKLTSGSRSNVGSGPSRTERR